LNPIDNILRSGAMKEAMRRSPSVHVMGFDVAGEAASGRAMFATSVRRCAFSRPNQEDAPSRNLRVSKEK
jgi:hypothetical protein